MAITPASTDRFQKLAAEMPTIAHAIKDLPVPLQGNAFYSLLNALDPEPDDIERERDQLREQVDRLASFILTNIPGEPSRSEGAVDTAIRLLDRLTAPSGVRDGDRAA